jgi:hypothetical protein
VAPFVPPSQNDEWTLFGFVLADRVAALYRPSTSTIEEYNLRLAELATVVLELQPLWCDFRASLSLACIVLSLCFLSRAPSRLHCAFFVLSFARTVRSELLSRRTWYRLLQMLAPRAPATLDHGRASERQHRGAVRPASWLPPQRGGGADGTPSRGLGGPFVEFTWFLSHFPGHCL